MGKSTNRMVVGDKIAPTGGVKHISTVTEDVKVHYPVLLAEAVAALAIESEGCYVDATFGRGGHSREILKHLGPNGRLLVMDKDPRAIEVAQALSTEDPRVTVVHGCFSDLKEAVTSTGWLGAVNGILLDLGVSSPQLDEAERGFSFTKEGPLDMRMNPTCGVSAAAWLQRIDERTLETVLREYGEERYARRIAKAIVFARQTVPLNTTTQLAAIVSKAIPKWERDKHPATRSFQAIRIAVNEELDALKRILAQSVEVLAPKGRLAVISFHSLEDRIVKQFIRTCEKPEDAYPASLPIRPQELKPSVMIAVGKYIAPTSSEVERNPRARSARLRVAERCL